MPFSNPFRRRKVEKPPPSSTPAIPNTYESLPNGNKEQDEQPLPKLVFQVQVAYVFK